MAAKLGDFLEITLRVASWMEGELARFMDYHEEVLQGDSFSLAVYLREEAVYRWKYDNTIFKKAGVFLGLLVLTFAQPHFVPTITFMALALIAVTLPY